jgi:hypothetical protein
MSCSPLKTPTGSASSSPSGSPYPSRAVSESTYSVLLNRDFASNGQPLIPRDTIYSGLVAKIDREFVNWNDFQQILQKEKEKENKKIFVFDTCFLLRTNIAEIVQGYMYVITCGVLLEILQGSTRKTIENGEFLKDLQKIIQIKEKLGNECVFLTLGRNRRAYWSDCQPSKSCRNCVNLDKPHHKILRDIDTELFRLTTVIKCNVLSHDNYLLKRISYHSKS